MTDVDATYDTNRPAGDEPIGGSDPVPAVVDWLLGALFGVIGVASAAVGIDMYTRLDRVALTEALTAEGVTLNGISESEAITAAVPFVDWFAAGMFVTGLGLIGGAVWFVLRRRHTRRRVSEVGGSTATFWACAVYGAAISGLVSLIPGSSAIGGGTAAYLSGSDDAVRTGAASGLIGALPTVPIAVAVAGGFVVAGNAIDHSGGAVLAGLIVVAELFVFLVYTGLGAAGGFVADRF